MSFLSVEPQSRVLLESYSHSLLAQFGTQLKIVADRYLAFFQERRKIEATYIDSLRKLHDKAKAVDAQFDPRAEPTTTRAAWVKVRDDIQREVDTRQGFADTLDNNVIEPLTTLKGKKDETRKRIGKDLKKSAANYADCAEDITSKLQRAYFKKYHPWFGVGRLEDVREPEPARSEEVSDDDCRRAVSELNSFRFIRVDILGDGYDCLEELAFTPIVENVLAKYMDGLVIAYAKYGELAMITRAKVENAFAGTDASGLRATFRRTLSFSIPPLAVYRNYPPGAYTDSDLIFGVPPMELTTNEDNVPKVMRMCIEEVEKRGLNTQKIYSVGNPNNAEVLQLRRRFESENTFSFSSTDNVHSVAMLLKLYLRDLPEPLLMLSSQDYRNYRQNRDRYTENDFSPLRSKIRELHPVHRASLEALLRHLLFVTSHPDKNAMTVKALAPWFYYLVLRGNEFWQDGINVKKLIMEDLIQHVHALFDERPSPPPPVPSPDVAETRSTITGNCFQVPTRRS